MMDNRFKVWDVFNDKWAAGRFLIDSDGLLFEFVRGYDWCAPYAACKPEYFRVVRCTGLKDRNDVLIYEGDIISEGIIGGVVNWDSTFGAWSWIEGEEWGMIDTNRVEVIGNIYENPEYGGGTQDVKKT